MSEERTPYAADGLPAHLTPRELELVKEINRYPAVMRRQSAPYFVAARITQRGRERVAAIEAERDIDALLRGAVAVE